MKNWIKKLLYFAIGAGFAIAGSVALAINVTVPQSPAAGSVIIGNAGGNYSASTTPVFVDTTNNKVGINTTTAVAVLDIYGTGNADPFNVSSTSNNSLFTITAGGNVKIATLTASSLILTDTNKNLISYGGASGCSNATAVTAISATGATTCSLNGLQAALTNPDTGIGTNGQVAYFTGATSLTSASALLTNGTVVGVNATTSNVALEVKGISGNNYPFIVASSSGATLLQITPAGSINLPTYPNGLYVNNLEVVAYDDRYANFYFADSGSSTVPFSGTGLYNMGMGIRSLESLTTGTQNIAIGYTAQQDLTSGIGNVSMGYTALGYNTTGSYNVSLGYNSGETGQGVFAANVLIGAQAVYNGSFPVSSSTIIGYQAGFNVAPSAPVAGNIFLGYQAGYDITSGANNIVIGYNTDAASNTASGQLDIGNIIYGTGLSVFSSPSAATSSAAKIGIGTTTPSNAFVVIGGIQQTLDVNCSTGLKSDASGLITGCVASDVRLKKDIKTLPFVDILSSIRPVFYNWKPSAKQDTNQHAGFIAQEVQKVLPQCVIPAGGDYLGIDANCMNAELWSQVQHLKVNAVKVTHSAEENWQWLIIALLGLGFVYQQMQIKRLK